MGHPNLIESDEQLAAIVRSMRTVAVVGIKDESRADQPAHEIPRMLADRGIDVIPVNPTIASALGKRALASVAELDRAVDLLNVFRRSDAIPGLADEVLGLPLDRRPAAVWLQTGIRHDAAAERMARAGIPVVQDRCLGVYVARYRRG